MSSIAARGLGAVFGLATFVCAPLGHAASRADAEIVQHIIQASIDAYPGHCPCPYSRAKNGSKCGRRSAYDRKGGEAPLCYPRDVTPEMVDTYRAEHGG